MSEHFLQSTNWEKYEHLEQNKTFRLEEKEYSALAILKSTPFGNYLFCPYGPTLRSPNSLPEALSGLQKLAHQTKSFFIRIEPTFPLDSSTIHANRLQKSHDIDPAHTWVLDLTVPEESLLDHIQKEKRRLWRVSPKKGVSIHRSKNPEDITILTDLLKQVTEKNHFTAQTALHLKNQLKSDFATLYIAELDKQPIAAALIYDYAGTRYYAHAAADYEHRKLSAGSTIVIQSILDAKKSGSHTYDFWGITTSTDPKHPWYGFTAFKKSFGGHQIDYAGTYDLPLRPLRYKIYQFFRWLNRLKRKH